MSPRRPDHVPLNGHIEPIIDGSAESGTVTSDLSHAQATQLEVALYVESMSAELKLMARSVDLDSLAYFLEMVRIEASLQIERTASRHG